jgi:hypothetical protein
MSKAAEIRRNTNFLAGQLLIAGLVIGYGFTIALSVPLFQGMRQITLYLVPVALIYLNVLAFIIASRGQSKIPTVLFVAGMVVIFGGAVFDMLATVIHSPNLSLEGNLYARMLIDTGHSLNFIYGYAIVAQFLFQLLFATLWTAFLRHRQTLIDLAWEANPKSKGEFIKAAFGMEQYTWRQMMFSFKTSVELYKRSMLQLLMSLAFIVAVAMPFRWWLGAEWFGIVPNIPDFMITFPLVLLGMFLYFKWLEREYDAGKTTYPITSP